MNQPFVCIIILNWNGLKDTIECIESLKKIKYQNYKIIVVDNASSNDEAYALREKYPEGIDILLAKENYGYTGGNNIGIEYALEKYNPDFILILNNDIIVDQDFLNHLVNVAQSDPQIGIVGGKVYYHRYPNLIQAAGAGLNMYFGKFYHIGDRKIDHKRYDYQKRVDYVMGCCMLIKRKVIEKVGLLDERYFCYWDESDYCFRCHRVGYDVVYTPLAKIWHKNPVKLKIWEHSQNKGRKTILPYYFSTRNNFIFMRKHANTLQYISFILYFFTFRFIFQTGVCLVFHRDYQRYIALWKGIIDGIKEFCISKPEGNVLYKKQYIVIT